MAFAADGELVDVDETRVRYRFRLMGGEWLGTFDIPLPVRDQVDLDAEDHVRTAVAVATKAVRRHRESGQWPVHVAFQS